MSFFGSPHGWGKTCASTDEWSRLPNPARAAGSPRRSPTCRAARNGSARDSSLTATRRKCAVSVCRASILAREGAVSEAVARAMAQGALRARRSLARVAVTGIAGPDGRCPGKPVGTVWFCWGAMQSQASASRSSASTFAGIARPCGEDGAMGARHLLRHVDSLEMFGRLFFASFPDAGDPSRVASAAAGSCCSGRRGPYPPRITT